MKLAIEIKLNPESKSPNQNLGKFPVKTYNTSIKNSRNLIPPKGMDYFEHEVKDGETLASIAEDYGIDPVQLAQFTREQEGSESIYPGMELKIPTLLEDENTD